MTAADHHLELDRPYKQGDPLDLDDARKASRRCSELRRAAEAELRNAVEECGRKEGAYRQALAKEIVTKRQEHPATVAVDLAKGEKNVNEALVAFRIAEGMVDAHKERLRTIEGERSQLKSLVDWSASISNVLAHADQQTAEQTPNLRSAA